MNEFDFVNNGDNKGNAFEKSLSEISAADIAPKREKVSPGVGAVAFNIFRYGLLFMFVGIFIYNMFSIVAEMMAYSRANELYSDLAERFESDDFVISDGDSDTLPIGSVPTPVPSFEGTMFGEEEEKNDETSSGAVARAKVEQLKQINAEAVGWIMIDGARISLPVVQADDNEKYLDIAFDGTENWTGTVFLDYRNSPTVSENRNTVLNGHNMEGGQMFNNLTKFLDEDFFFANRYIELYSNEGIEIYEVFSVYKAREDYICADVNFETDTDFVDFCYEMKSNSFFDAENIDFTEGDKIITLITCTNGDKRDRYIVQGKLIQVEK